MVKVLVVDDDIDVRRLLEATLVAEGFKVLTAADGAEAIRVQKENPADLLVTDLFMPNTDGMETIGLWKRLYPACKIIAISGGLKHGQGDYLKVAGTIGADDYLLKPFGIGELVEKIRKLTAGKGSAPAV